MRKIRFCLLVGIILSTQTFPNLIVNPGFENGSTGWTAFWSRVPGAGSGVVITDTVHSGTHSLRIHHWGDKDWSMGQAGKINVKPGYIIAYNGWANVVRCKGSAQFSVILYDSADAVLDWSFSPAELKTTGGAYSFFKTNMIIPDRTRRIMARIMGEDSCLMYVDDLSLVITDSSTTGRSYTLKNSSITATIMLPSFAIDIKNNSATRSFRTLGPYTFYIASVDSFANTFIFNGRYVADSIPVKVTCSLLDKNLKMELSADSSAKLVTPVQFPGAISSAVGDYLIVPRASGLIIPVTRQYPFWDFSMYDYKATMAFAGVTDLQQGYMLISDNPWDTDILFNGAGNPTCYAPQMAHVPSKGCFGYTRTFYLTPVEQRGYVRMCEIYREHAQRRGLVKTFQQKTADNPAMVRLPGAVDFWALCGSAFLQYRFYDTLRDFGVDRAIVSLGGGWQGPSNVAALIDSINARGYITSRYDIYTDVWPPDHPEIPSIRTEGYPQDVIVDKNGILQKGWLMYINDTIPFQGYYTCAHTHAAYAQKWLSQELPQNHYIGRFIDVELASALYECYSNAHPAGRREDAAHRRQLFEKVKDQFKLVTGGEEARDWAFPSVDFGEGTMSQSPVENAGYDWYTPVDNPDSAFIALNMDPSIRVPLHSLVYHDVHLATWYTGDGASKVPSFWDDKDLFNALYGSMQLFMPPSNAYWNTNCEKFITSYHLVSSIGRETGLAKMTDHSFLTTNRKVQKSVFDNEWEVVVNFDANPFVYQAVTVPSKGLYASNGKHIVARMQYQNHTAAIASIGDRLFINPYTVETGYGGVRTSRTVLLQRFATHVHVAFIGSMSSVDIKPADLPWPATTIRAFTKNKEQEITLQPQADGWLRLNKLTNYRFYRLEGDFAGIGNVIEPNAVKVKPSVLLNRASPIARISYSIQQPGTIQCFITDCTGRKLCEIETKHGTAGRYTIPVNISSLAQGVYLCTVRAGNAAFCVRFVWVR